MIGWAFAGITLTAVLAATFARNTRNAILALWVAGLGIGAVYLTLGAEFLAIIQWIVSTLVTISFIFFAVMFGEYHSSNKGQPHVPPKGISRVSGQWFFVISSLVLGVVFASVIWIGVRDLPEGASVVTPTGSDLSIVGRILTHDHLLSLEVLALTLFLVLVGGGVIARFEGEERP